MEAKFTRGPWRVGGPNGMLNQVSIEPSIGVAYGAGEELVANANIMAASPLLYEVLEAVEWISSHGFTFCPCCNHTKQAGHALDCALNNALRAARGEK